jgi:hypothetical protein
VEFQINTFSYSITSRNKEREDNVSESIFELRFWYLRDTNVDIMWVADYTDLHHGLKISQLLQGRFRM